VTGTDLPAGARSWWAGGRWVDTTAGLTLTGHHRGFTHVHPSGLPLARSFPRMKRGPLGFTLGLRTPTGQDGLAETVGAEHPSMIVRVPQAPSAGSRTIG
jgi:hypothetical protein